MRNPPIQTLLFPDKKTAPMGGGAFFSHGAFYIKDSFIGEGSVAPSGSLSSIGAINLSGSFLTIGSYLSVRFIPIFAVLSLDKIHSHLVVRFVYAIRSSGVVLSWQCGSISFIGTFVGQGSFPLSGSIRHGDSFKHQWHYLRGRLGTRRRDVMGVPHVDDGIRHRWRDAEFIPIPNIVKM